MLSKYPSLLVIFLVWPNDEIISLGSQNMPKYLYLEKEELMIRFWVSEISIQNVKIEMKS